MKKLTAILVIIALFVPSIVQASAVDKTIDAGIETVSNAQYGYTYTETTN